MAVILPYGWINKCLDFYNYFLIGVTKYKKLIICNPPFLQQVEGVDIIGVE